MQAHIHTHTHIRTRAHTHTPGTRSVDTLTCYPRGQAIKDAASLSLGLEELRVRWGAFLLPDEVIQQGLHQPARQLQAAKRKRTKKDEENSLGLIESAIQLCV